MSLIQAALDRAEQPEDKSPQTVVTPSPPKKEIPVVQAPEKAKEIHHEPRLNAIRFYETQNQVVEESIAEVQKENAKQKISTSKKENQPRNTQNYWTPILALILLSLLFSRFLIPNASKKTSQETKAPEAVLTVKPQPVVVKRQAPLSPRPISQTKFFLTGITASDNIPLAVINNQVVGQGDKLREGATVKSITDTRVVLEMDGKQIVLNF